MKINKMVCGFAVLVLMHSYIHGGYGQDAFQQIMFPSKDGLEITADYYAPHPDKSTPVIVLCHQARWSRGEYREIAPKLNKLGFNCLAIDQRSGGEVNDVANETMARAKDKGLGTAFLDARQDIVAALEHAHAELTDGKVMLWGSSYSAALSLHIGGENGDLVDAVLSFAPGEYFARFGKPGDFIQQAAANISDPVFITSAKNEFPNWQAIFDAIDRKDKMKFVPETKGNHGSRALWEQFDDHGDYWENVETFLKPLATSEVEKAVKQLNAVTRELAEKRNELVNRMETVKEVANKVRRDFFKAEANFENRQEKLVVALADLDKRKESLAIIKNHLESAKEDPGQNLVINGRELTITQVEEAAARIFTEYKAEEEKTESLKKTVSVMKDSLVVLEKQRETIEMGVSELKSRIVNLEEKMDLLEAMKSIKAADDPIELLNIEIEEIHDEIEKLNVQIDSEIEREIDKRLRKNR